jgi:hypothetical protein
MNQTEDFQKKILILLINEKPKNDLNFQDRFKTLSQILYD